MWIDYAVRKGITAPGAFVRLPVLLNAARTSGSRFPEKGDTVISLTTHGTRLKSAAAAIASLLVGIVRLPVHLWLDPVDFHARWPDALQGLAERGLQVHESPGGLGPHTKYYGTFQKFPDSHVITVDDDVWLNHCALRAGFPVQQVSARSANFPLVPGSQRVRLSRVNLSGGNDVQIAATYSAEDVSILRAAE